MRLPFSIRTLFYALALAALLVPVGCATSKAERAQEEGAKAGAKLAYVDQLAQFDQQQILLGRSALENSTDLGVRRFAMQLIDDHQRHLDMLRGWTQARSAELAAINRNRAGVGGAGTAGTDMMGLTAPSLDELSRRIDGYEERARTVDVATAPELSKLEGKSGNDFDRAFLDRAKKAAEEGRKMVRDGQDRYKGDPTFAGLLAQTEPMLQQQENWAATLQERLQ